MASLMLADLTASGVFFILSFEFGSTTLTFQRSQDLTSFDIKDILAYYIIESCGRTIVVICS